MYLKNMNKNNNQGDFTLQMYRNKRKNKEKYNLC